MADNSLSRSERYAAELKKLQDKRNKIDGKIREATERMEEAQKLEIFEYMKAKDLSPRQLKIIIEHTSHNMPGDVIVDLEPADSKEEKEKEAEDGE